MRERKVKEPIVSIVKSDNEQLSIVEALDLLPVREIIKDGAKVVITPNWVSKKAPSTGAVVGPESLRELIQYVKRFHPGKITVATGSGGKDTGDVFRAIGYDQILQTEAVEFVDLNYGPYIDLELDHDIISKTKINAILTDMDVLISFAQLKQHEEATITATIKNVAMGWPPAEIHGFPKKETGIHDDLHGFIAAMSKKIPIDLSVLSVDKAMIGTGPNDGIAVDTNGLVIASTDPVAADTIGARLMGFLPQAVHYLYVLYKDHIGEADIKRMDLRGIPLHEAERIFSLAAYGQEIILDREMRKGVQAQ